MLTLIFSLLAGCCTFYGLVAAKFSETHPNLTVFFAVLAFIAVQIMISLLLRLRSKRINANLQAIMMDVQQKIQVKQNQFMRRPQSQDAMMRILKHEQNVGIDRMLDALEQFRPLFKWNFMMAKQVNTMRMMFLYQQEKFDLVDQLQPKCLYVDAQSVAMRLARMYVNKDAGLDKFFRRKCRRFKKDEAALLYSEYAWMLVKQERCDEAIQVLNDAKTKSGDNPTIISNWETLVNKKPKHFSNSQLGEMWYALMLEKPKMPRIQQQQPRYR